MSFYPRTNGHPKPYKDFIWGRFLECSQDEHDDQDCPGVLKGMPVLGKGFLDDSVCSCPCHQYCNCESHKFIRELRQKHVEPDEYKRMLEDRITEE